MKKILFAAAASTALIMASSAMAEVSFNVVATSDYVFRGFTQTDENPAIQGGIDYSSGIFYAGAWASNVDFGTDASSEVDLYAGVKPSVGDYAFDLAAIYYAYPDEDDLNYAEFKAAVSHPAGKGSVGAALYYSPDFFAGTDQAIYTEVNGSYPLTEKLSVSGALGYQDVDYDGDYTTWNIGGSYALTDVFSADLRYHDSDFDSAFSDERVVLSLKAVF